MRCAASGALIIEERLRWDIRTSGGGARGPLSRDAVMDQLVRGAAGADDLIARGGGAWLPIAEHKDFRASFIDGTSEFQRINGNRAAERSEVRSGKVRRGARSLVAVAAAGVSVAFAGWALESGVLVMPEELVDGVSDAVGEGWEKVSTTVQIAAGNTEVNGRGGANRELPGEPLLHVLKERWPSPEGTAVERLHRGRAALWDGTTPALEKGREELEKAAVLSPMDGEIWAALAETYAVLSEREPGLLAGASSASDRASALISGASAQRATSAVAFADGRRPQAADAATPCGDPPAAAVEPGKGVDPGCAFFVAASLDRAADLAILAKAYPESFRLALGRAQVELRLGRLDEGVAILTDLSRRYPGESEPWGLLLETQAELGDWQAAVAAGERLAKLSPGDIRRRTLLARIQLKALRDSESAATQLADLRALPGIGESPWKAEVFAESAAAEFAEKRYAESVELADRALSVTAGAPGAVLIKALALTELGKSSDAEGTLRLADTSTLSPYEASRFHTMAGLIHSRAGRERNADAEFSAALEVQHGAVLPLLARSWVKLQVGDTEAALRYIEEVAYTDISALRTQTPLVNVWWPEKDWRELETALVAALSSDVRNARRLEAARGILAWVRGSADARGLLERSVAGGAVSPPARACLAQLWLERGFPAQAQENAEAVRDRNGDPAIVLGVRARAASLQKQAGVAVTLFGQSFDKDTSLAVVHRWRAEHLLETGDVDAAIQAAGEAARLAPGDLEVKKLQVNISKSRR